MKNFLLTFALACLSASFAFAETFFVKNATGSRTFYSIRVSHGNSNQWGPNLLFDQSVAPGGVFKYDAPFSLARAQVDIFIEDDKGDTYSLMARSLRPRETVEVSLGDMDQRSGRPTSPLNLQPGHSDAPHAQQPRRGSDRPAPPAGRGSMAGRADPDAANWNLALLDTAKDADYLSAIEKDVILETNKVRSDPKKYAALYIRPMLQFFKGTDYAVPGQVILATKEGARAVNECIAALNRAEPAPPLSPERGLSLSARDHTRDQGSTGQTGHTGSDGSSMSVRMKRYGVFGGSFASGENIMYGCPSGREIVCGLLVDDGVPSRGHRTNIMSKDFSQTGAAEGPHPRFRNMCTINYAKGYQSN